MNRILISIVTYNTDPVILRKLLHKLNNDFVISIFDNSSNDIIKKEISSLAKLKNVVCRSLNQNIGFGNAHNRNIFDSDKDFDYVLILNPDMDISSYQINVLLESLIIHRSDRVSIISPILINKDGSLQKFIREIPSIFSFFKKIFSINQINYSEYISNVANVPIIHGACLLMSKKDYYKINGFSNEYFLYWEDLDLCRKVHFYNGKVLVDSNIRCIHLHNRESHRSASLAFIHLKSIIIYFKKWGLFQNKTTKKINKVLLNKLITRL